MIQIIHQYVCDDIIEFEIDQNSTCKLTINPTILHVNSTYNIKIETETSNPGYVWIHPVLKQLNHHQNQFIKVNKLNKNSTMCDSLLFEPLNSKHFDIIK